MVAGKVVVVTGAARGLGHALAVGMAESGARVVAVVRPRPPGKSAESPPESGRLLRIEADVTDENDCARVVTEAVGRFGSLDVLVNNAAVAHDAFPRVHESEFSDVLPDLWRRVFDVNVNGTFLMTRAAAPAMIERGWGRVINLSTSKSTMLAPGVLPYGPSKAAVEAMTVGWSLHLAATGVTVNEVLPGGPAGARTPDKHWLPENRMTWPAEIMLPPVRWLASSASDAVTGCRFIARLWDTSLPDAEAANRAGAPAGWPLAPDDFAERPST